MVNPEKMRADIKATRQQVADGHMSLATARVEALLMIAETLAEIAAALGKAEGAVDYQTSDIDPADLLNRLPGIEPPEPWPSPAEKGDRPAGEMQP